MRLASIRSQSLPGAVFALVLIAMGCAERRSPSASLSSRTILVMGTTASVKLPSTSASRLREAADIVETIFRDIEEKMSRYRPDSELSEINRQAGRTPVRVSPVTLNTVVLAKQYARLSDGAFDPTVAPLVQLWQGDTSDRRELPGAEALARARELVDYQEIRVDMEERTVFLQQEGMSMDLGGIAKGKAADLAAKALAKAGFEDFLIDLGGDIRSRGAPDGHSAWRVGVRDPFDTGQLLGVLNLKPLPAVTTSGNYERFVIIDGEQFGHLIDPRTGRTVQEIAGVTVIARTAAGADAISTALYIAGIRQAPRIIERVPDVEALLIPNRRPTEIWVTPGINAMFEPHPEHRNAIRFLSSDTEFQ